MASDWFSSQVNLYDGMAERNLLIIKQAQAVRMEQELEKVNEKYDGSAAASIEADINKLNDDKVVVSQWLDSVNGGLKRFQDVRQYMLQMKATLAVSTPSSEAFDNYFDALNSQVSNEKYNKNSVISNNTNNRGSWTDTTTMVSSGVMSAAVTHHYVGNDYAIELDGGAGLMTSARDGTLTGGGHTIERKNLQMVSFSDDHVEFQDVTDPANPVTFSGTIKRGGLGVLPSWLYGDLTVPANQDRVKADLTSGFKNLARIELDFNVDQAQLSGMHSSLTSKMRNLQTDYERVSTEEVNAKTAEKKAIQTRFDIYNNALALTSARSSNYIQQMFNTSLPTKQSFKDALLSAYGY